MKKIFIIHRWGGTPDSDWYPWLKQKLENKGFEVQVPKMPNSDEPEIDAWVSHLKKLVKNPDKDTYFIGHSIGCQTIMRYLESLPANVKVGDAVFIAGWFNLDNLEGEEVESIANPWIKTSIDFNKVKQKLGKLTVFLSTNEPYGLIEKNSKIFKEKLGAKVIIEKNKGHFTEDDNITEMPEIISNIL